MLGLGFCTEAELANDAHTVDDLRARPTRKPRGSARQTLSTATGVPPTFDPQTDRSALGSVPLAQGPNLAIWQKRDRRCLSSEDVRQIRENLRGFFRVLADWDTRARTDGFGRSTDEGRRR